jgi:hypothetical protein
LGSISTGLPAWRVRRNHGGHVGQAALAVVRKQDGVVLRHQLVEKASVWEARASWSGSLSKSMRSNCCCRPMTRSFTVVCRLGRVPGGSDAGGAHQRFQAAAGLVVTDHANKAGLCAQHTTL